MKDRIRNTIEAALKGAGIAYETDGEIADTGTVCCNRNGRYRVFEGRGNDVLCVKVEIRPIGQ